MKSSQEDIKRAEEKERQVWRPLQPDLHDFKPQNYPNLDAYVWHRINKYFKA